MPNTLCHFALQTPLNRPFLEKRDIAWTIAGCIIPDLPWIWLKGLLATGLFDPYNLRLYAMAQASLCFCLILSVAVATLTNRPVRIFTVLGVNCLAHLLIDALQIKWGNGVHLFAPFNWDMFHLGFSWPEHLLTQALTVAGIPVLLYHWRAIVRGGLNLKPVSALPISFSVILLLCYLAGPPLFFERLESTDSYYISTMRNIKQRTNRKIEFDRARYDARTRTLENYAGERFSMAGLLPDKSGRVSFQGFFTSPETITATAYHYHRDYRDSASILGLFMACILFVHSLLTTISGKTRT